MDKVNKLIADIEALCVDSEAMLIQKTTTYNLILGKFFSGVRKAFEEFKK